MELNLHANATTTPKTRAYIQQSPASIAHLAEELGVCEATIRRWKKRDTVEDRSHRPHRLSTSLTDLDQRLVIELRKSLQLSLDDIVEVMKRCVSEKLSRSAIHRCLQRHGISKLAKPEKAKPGTFDTDQPLGFIHIDLKHLTRLEGQRTFVFVAIDRATRFVYIEIIERRDGDTVAACFERFIKAFPYPVHTVLSDNGSEFTDRFGGARWHKRKSGTGRHAFDRVCQAHGIEHRLTRPYHPQTNGMVERFNRRLAEAINAKKYIDKNAGKNKFETHAERNNFLKAFVDNYNRTRLRCLGYRAPLEVLSNLTGHNTQAGTQSG